MAQGLADKHVAPLKVSHIEKQLSLEHEETELRQKRERDETELRQRRDCEEAELSKARTRRGRNEIYTQNRKNRAKTKT